MPRDIPFPYRSSFDDSILSVCKLLAEWMDQRREGAPDFSDSEDCVYIKNRDRVLVYVNDRYLRTFAVGGMPLGQRGEAYLETALARVSTDTDSLLDDGYRSVEVEHVADGRDGHLHLLRTFKRSLAEYGLSDLWILGVTRSMAQLGSTGEVAGRTLAECARLYRELSAEEAEMCRLYALGETTKAIAESLGVTPRTIELRRQRILDTFGFHRPVEIVKMLVRLQANGLIDIDV